MPEKIHSESENEEYPFSTLWNDFDRRLSVHEYYTSQGQEPAGRFGNWVGSTDNSGYIRERCLRNLISEYELGDENRILLRLADWVPEIQSIAREWILDKIEEVPLHSLIRNSELILYLARKDKLKDDAGFQKIEETLLDKIQHLEAARFYELDREFRKHVYGLSLDRDQKLRNRIVNEENPFLRIFLLKHSSCTMLSDDEVRLFAQDQSVIVLREFVLFRIRNQISITKDEFMRLAIHRNYGLRDIGRFYLKKYFDTDCYQMYKSFDSENFYFIADYAKPEDIESFIRGIETGDKFVKLLCLRALIGIDKHQLNKFDINVLLRNGRIFRKMLYANLPKVKSVDQLKAMKPIILEHSDKGLNSYLSMMLNKSFWNFVDEALQEYLENPSDSLFCLLDHTVKENCASCKPPSLELKEQISKKTETLGLNRDYLRRKLSKLIKFYLGEV